MVNDKKLSNFILETLSLYFILAEDEASLDLYSLQLFLMDKPCFYACLTTQKSKKFQVSTLIFQVLCLYSNYYPNYFGVNLDIPSINLSKYI